MRDIPTKRLLASAQKGFRDEIRQEYALVARQIRSAILRYADADGQIAVRDGARVRWDAGELAARMFALSDRQVFREDGVTPLTRYAWVLMKWYVKAVVDVVVAHRDWMRRELPEDVWRYLSTAPTRDLDFDRVQEQLTQQQINDLRIFHPNPMAEIDPSRVWVPIQNWTDPNGYRLSDRIWRAGEETRRKIDLILAKGLAEGMSALELAAAVEAYLVPTRTGVRTLKPYGERFMPDGASFDGMRLARTEISRAHNQAAYTAAYLNPYVGGMDWALSASHPRIDNCDNLATIGKGGQRIKPPYTIHSVKVPPDHPHCLCRIQTVNRDNPHEVTRRLREMAQDAEEELVMTIGPAKAETFIEQLVGGILLQTFPQVLQGLLL